MTFLGILCKFIYFTKLKQALTSNICGLVHELRAFSSEQRSYRATDLNCTYPNCELHT